jgi:hypothetical protein
MTFKYLPIASFFLIVITVCNHVSAHTIKETQVIRVSNTPELRQAIKVANNRGYTEILMQPGNYDYPGTINISAPHISLVSKTRNPKDVVISGTGMRATKEVSNLLRISGQHFTLDGITLRNTGNHLVQIAGEKNADYPTLKNCILLNAYEQMVKVSYNRNTGIASDFGHIENCHFEYTHGIGPQYYIGGIDVHGGQDWVVQNNTFIGIASPEKRIAEHAIHFWNNTQNITVKGNTIINCDRGIGFGMPNRPNFGGIIHNNLILHADNNHPRADTGIVLEESQGTIVTNNRIFLKHSYPNAIEYRFRQTKNVLIKGNKVNKRIQSRNGGKAKLEDNVKVISLEQVLTAQELNLWQPLL